MILARVQRGPTLDTFEAQLDKYVTLILKLGLNLQPGQVLVLAGGSRATSIEVADIARLVVRRAYELGARDVHVVWDDDELTRMRVQYAAEEALSDVPAWRVKWFEELSAQGAAFLALYAPNPDLLRDVDPRRAALLTTATNRAFASFSAASSRLEHPWTLASVATRAWARKVFPQMTEAAAIEALWGYIFRATRIDAPDPLRAWQEHLHRLNERAALLNQAHFSKLQYSAPGTALTIELPARHTWVSAGNAVSAGGTPFVPNLPTEEVFTLPAREGVHGTVRSTMPVNYNGTLIDHLALTFDRGRIVDYSADSGYGALRSIIETDVGARYLGEVALVTADSPANFGTPLFNTLFDENASCHLAIGRAYPTCLEGGEQMTPQELTAHGANLSDTHVDFMIGSPGLEVVGETATGERIPILRGGTWALGTTPR